MSKPHCKTIFYAGRRKLENFIIASVANNIYTILIEVRSEIAIMNENGGMRNEEITRRYYKRLSLSVKVVSYSYT